MALLPAGAGEADVLAWERSAGDDRRVVAVSFAAEPRSWSPPAGEWAVEVSSAATGREGGAFAGVLEPHEAVVLRPV